MTEEYDEIDISDGEEPLEEIPSGEEDSPSEDSDNERTAENDTSFFSFRMPDSALCVAVSPVDPCVVCVGCLDNSARVFTVDSAGAPQTSIELLGHTDSVVSVKFSPDGVLVATASYDGTIRLWSVTSGEQISVLDETGSEIELIVFHPTENVLVAGCADGSVWLWTLAGGEPMLKHMLRGHSHGSRVSTLNFIGKSSQGLLTASEEGVGIVWNLATGQVVHKTKAFGGSIISASVHPSKPIYALGLDNGCTYILHGETGKVLHKLITKGSVESVNFSACDSLLAVATLEGILEIWSIENLNGYPRHKIDLPSRLETNNSEDFVGFTKLVWHPDTSLRCLVSVGKAGRVDVWNAMSGEHLTALEGHTADVMDLAVVLVKDPQERSVARIVSVCDDGFLKMFSVSEDNQ